MKKDGLDYTDYTPELQKLARRTGEYAKVLFNLKKCVFCDLREKYLITEKDGIVLTVNLFPYINGHLLLIPRRHVLKLNKLTALEWSAVKDLFDIGRSLLAKAYGFKDVNLIYREGERAGKTVWHLHFNLFPYDPKLIEWRYQAITEEPIKVAEELRNRISF